MTFPAVFYSIKWSLPPVVVASQQEADRLDPAEWAALTPKAAEPVYPKLFLNVNVPPRIIVSANQEAALSAEWRDFTSIAVAVAEARPPDVPPVTISPSSATVAADGGSGSFSVTMTGAGQSGTWIATKDAAADWLNFTPTEPQSTDGTVDYMVAAHTGAARSANIYVNGKTFTVNQDGV